MAFELPQLPYDPRALEPHMSAETLEFHHGKHHKAYIEKINGWIGEKRLDGMSLVEIIRHAREQGDETLFDNAGQAWNHNFFWQCLTPGGRDPSAALTERINGDFGSFDELIEKLTEEAVNHFGSGWAWLVLDGDRIRVASYHDGDTPVAHPRVRPLFTIDVWEHAYYIDYRNERPKFVEAVLRNLVNWDFVEENLDGFGAERADLDAEAMV